LEVEVVQARKFHLGWFANFCIDAWNDQWGSTGGQNWSGDFYVELEFSPSLRWLKR